MSAVKSKAKGKGGEKGQDLLDMKQAVEMLKTSRATFYRWLREGRVRGMKVGRQWRFERGEIERFLKGEAPKIEVRGDIGSLIATLEENLSGESGKADYAAQRIVDQARAAVGDKGLDRVVALTMQSALRMRASDIHMAASLDPESGNAVGTLRFRIDGVLHVIARFDVRLLAPMVVKWKAMSACNPEEKSCPQDGRILADCDGYRLDLRVSFLPAQLGEGLTARILSGVDLLSLERLEYSPADRERIERNVRSPWGLVLSTGPTGSGKTTTLYACLALRTGSEEKVVSIEDPVEYLIPWVTQVPVHPQKGMTFPVAVRAALRSDPDTILIGEIRDKETANMAVQAALTGHMVLSTLHTNSAAKSLGRLVDIGVPAFVLADAVRLVIAQRLVRIVCPKCSRPVELSAEDVALARGMAEAGGLRREDLPPSYRRAEGCENCHGLGFRGRCAAAETLEVGPEVARVLRDGGSVEELQAAAVAAGMTTMAADGIRRVASGQTSLEEVRRVMSVGMS